VTWLEECTALHLATARALLQAFHAESAGIAEGIGTQATTELITAHQLWRDWLGGGRVRKFALVAENRSDGAR
jgi:hypothetical protein